jgi:hypothetical protein
MLTNPRSAAADVRGGISGSRPKTGDSDNSPHSARLSLRNRYILLR